MSSSSSSDSDYDSKSGIPDLENSNSSIDPPFVHQYEPELQHCSFCNRHLPREYRTPDWDHLAEEAYEQAHSGWANVSYSGPIPQTPTKMWEYCYFDTVITSDSEPEDCTCYGSVLGYKLKGKAYCTKCYLNLKSDEDKDKT